MLYIWFTYMLYNQERSRHLTILICIHYACYLRASICRCLSSSTSVLDVYYFLLFTWIFEMVCRCVWANVRWTNISVPLNVGLQLAERERETERENRKCVRKRETSNCAAGWLVPRKFYSSDSFFLFFILYFFMFFLFQFESSGSRQRSTKVAKRKDLPLSYSFTDCSKEFPNNITRNEGTRSMLEQSNGLLQLYSYRKYRNVFFTKVFSPSKETPPSYDWVLNIFRNVCFSQRMLRDNLLLPFFTQKTKLFFWIFSFDFNFWLKKKFLLFENFENNETID